MKGFARDDRTGPATPRNLVAHPQEHHPGISLTGNERDMIPEIHCRTSEYSPRSAVAAVDLLPGPDLFEHPLLPCEAWHG